MAKRAIIIAGNWKMNKTPKEACALAKEVAEKTKNAACGVVICVPFVDLATAAQGIAQSNVHLGAQNVHWEANGAFTGEISAPMLLDLGVEYVVVAHSERRQYFGETDESANKRVKAAIAAGLFPILCVGESESERDTGKTEEVIERQMRGGLAGISAEEAQKLVIAYEPVWAIGTGKTATAQQAQDVCAFIRSLLVSLFDNETAQSTTIQYGGSMNAKNASELLSMPDIDGGLIGGASLKPEDFAVIVQAGSEKAGRQN